MSGVVFFESVKCPGGGGKCRTFSHRLGLCAKVFAYWSELNGLPLDRIALSSSHENSSTMIEYFLSLVRTFGTVFPSPSI